MSDIIIKPGELSIDAQLPAQFVEDRDQALEVSKAITSVTSDREMRQADAARKEIKALCKQVNAERMSITRKLDGFKKACIEREREICAALSGEETRITALLTGYASAKAEAEAEARRKAAEEAAVEAAVTGGEVDAVEEKTGPLVSGVRTRKVVTFEIVDADAVPRAYCSPSETLIREYIQSVKNANPDWDESSFKIPGVVFKKEVRA